MLESLDRDYKRDEDWCGTDRANISDKPSYMVQLINKHNEQKEAFLKVIFHLHAFESSADFYQNLIFRTVWI